MVMPILLGFDLLPFRRVGEFADMFLQWLKVVSIVFVVMYLLQSFQGLEMHEHSISYWCDSFCQTSSFAYSPTW